MPENSARTNPFNNQSFKPAPPSSLAKARTVFSQDKTTPSAATTATKPSFDQPVEQAEPLPINTSPKLTPPSAKPKVKAQPVIPSADPSIRQDIHSQKEAFSASPQTPLKEQPFLANSGHEPTSDNSANILKFLIALVVVLIIAGIIFLVVYFYQNFSSFFPGKETIEPDKTTQEITEKIPPAKQYGADDLVSAHQSFGFNMLKQIYEVEPNENIFISPLSLSLSMSLLANGSEGQTQQQLMNSLQVGAMPVEDLRQASGELVKKMAGYNFAGEMTIANSVWFDSDFGLKEEFLNSNTEFYDITIGEIDFQDKKQFSKIDSWLNENMQYQPEFSVQNSLEEETRMYLISGLYLRGSWVDMFKVGSTANFNSAKGEATVDYLHLYDTVMYLENDDLQAVKFNLTQTGQMELYLILPKANIRSLLEMLSVEKWQTWREELLYSGTTQIDLSVPQFKASTKIDITKILPSIGLEDLSTEQADLSGISDSALMLSGFDHFINFKLDQTGVEAAGVAVNRQKVFGAFTDADANIEVKPTGESDPVMMVDRPFLIVVTEKDTAEILIIGVVQNPN